MPGHGTPGPFRDLITEGNPPIELTSLFSAPEGQQSCAAAAPPSPATNPFQAPDFGEDDTDLLEAGQDSASDISALHPTAP